MIIKALKQNSVFVCFFNSSLVIAMAFFLQGEGTPKAETIAENTGKI